MGKRIITLKQVLILESFDIYLLLAISQLYNIKYKYLLSTQIEI